MVMQTFGEQEIEALRFLREQVRVCICGTDMSRNLFISTRYGCIPSALLQVVTISVE